MSNIRHLLQAFARSPQAVEILAKLAQPAARIELSGTAGAQEAFVIAAAVLGKTTGLHLVIANSKEEAAYLQNDLAGILEGERTVHFFPDSFKRPAFFDDLHPTQMLQRSEAINKISLLQHEGAVVVAYPEALFEKVVSPETLNQHRIEVNTGEKLDVDFVISVLVEYGFERADFVYEPGQFSIRGGIVDLFSFGNDLPYRIELFDDEVESIRLFDPLTQLSQKNISRVSIVPNLNTRFRQEQKRSLLQIISTNATVWVRDFQFLLDRLQYCFEKAEQFAQKLSGLDSAELREIFRDRAFLYPADVVEDIADRSVVFLEKQSPEVLRVFLAVGPQHN